MRRGARAGRRRRPPRGVASDARGRAARAPLRVRVREAAGSPLRARRGERMRRWQSRGVERPTAAISGTMFARARPRAHAPPARAPWPLSW
eukprot:4983108-Prymnesium_polylepis.1